MACLRPRGPAADVVKALIKLAAAGVKVREGQEHGVRTHSRRAAELFAASARSSRPLISLVSTWTSGPVSPARSARIRLDPGPHGSTGGARL